MVILLKFKKHLLLLAFTAMAVSLHAQWTVLPSGTTVSFVGVAFPSKDHGIAISQSNIRYTFDGGESWAWSQLNAGSGTFTRVKFISDSTGWISTGDFPGGIIYKSTNGGVSWKSISRLPHPVYSFCFFNEQTGWAALNDATGGTHFIYKTTDGGITWSRKESGSDYIRDIHFSSAACGWVAGDNGAIYTSTDSGNTWQLSKTNVVMHFNSIFAISDSVAWAVGAYQYGACYKTTDGGKSWKAQTIPTLAHLKSVQFISPDTGWIAGDRGVVLSTNDGGHLWFAESTDISEDLTCIYFIHNKGYALGRNGMVIKY